LSYISKTEPKASAFAPAKIWPETQEAAVPVRVPSTHKERVEPISLGTIQTGGIILQREIARKADEVFAEATIEHYIYKLNRGRSGRGGLDRVIGEHQRRLNVLSIHFASPNR